MTSEKKETTMAPRRQLPLLNLFVGVFLSIGGILALFAGHHTPDNPALVTLIPFLAGLTGAILVFRGKARRAVTGLAILALLLTVLNLMVRYNHMSVRYLTVSDYAALALLLSAALLAPRQRLF